MCRTREEMFNYKVIKQRLLIHLFDIILKYYNLILILELLKNCAYVVNGNFLETLAEPLCVCYPKYKTSSVPISLASRRNHINHMY